MDKVLPVATTLFDLVALAGLSLANLWQGYRHDSSEVRRLQFRPLFLATVLAALGGLDATIGIWLGIDLPELPRDVAFGVAVALLGFAVARHNALVEGRVISALMLYDGMRTTLDRLIYRGQFRQLRANLRSLASEAGGGQSQSEQLQIMLAWLCETLSVKRGAIALAEDGAFVVQASQEASLVGQAIPRPTILGHEITELPATPPHGPASAAGYEALQGMALLVPIAAGGSQVEALLLGSKAADQPLPGR